MIIWRKQTTGVVVALAVLATGPAAAQSSLDGGVKVEIVEFGAYQVTNRVNGVPSATGQRDYVAAHDLITRTDQICTRLKTTFAIEYEISGAPPGEAVMLTVVTRFPPAGLVDDQGVKFASNGQTGSKAVGVRYIRSFTFDEPFEMVTGTWTFEIHHQDRVVAAKSFSVRNCDPVS
jgi:Domain of unknown function (DUF3859)